MKALLLAALAVTGIMAAAPSAEASQYPRPYLYPGLYYKSHHHSHHSNYYGSSYYAPAYYSGYSRSNCYRPRYVRPRVVCEPTYYAPSCERVYERPCERRSRVSFFFGF